MMMPYLGLMLASPLLCAMVFHDLRHMQIPKWVSGGMIAIFVGMGLTLVPWAESGARLAVAGGVFAAGFAAFTLRMIGGGDVKALSAMMLLIPVPALTLFMLVFAACLMLGVVGVLVARGAYGHADSTWAFLRNKTFPMGISISGAGLISPIVAWMM